MDFRPASIAAQQGEDEEDQTIDFRPSAILNNNAATNSNSSEEFDFRPASINNQSTEALPPPGNVVNEIPPISVSPPLVDPFSIQDVLQYKNQSLLNEGQERQAELLAIAAEKEKQQLARQAERNVIKENIIANQAPPPEVNHP